MKTAINLLTILLMGAFLIFLTTLTFQNPQENHPPPKSTRIISPSSKSAANPFSKLQNSTQTLTDEELKSAIKIEWLKLNDRASNRELPILIAHLRELGRREALDGIKFLETLPLPKSPLDYLQAQLAIVAGWGIDDYIGATTYLYRENCQELKLPSKYSFFRLIPIILNQAQDLVADEMQHRWINNDPDGFVAMIEESDSGFPVSPSRQTAVRKRFPLLTFPNPIEVDPFQQSTSLEDRFHKYYRSALGGQRANSLFEWSARNSDRALQLLHDPDNPLSKLLHRMDLSELMLGLSFQTPHYQNLFQHTPIEQRFMLTLRIAASINNQGSNSNVWPLDARPDPLHLTRIERSLAFQELLQSDPSLLENVEEYNLKIIRSALNPE